METFTVSDVKKILPSLMAFAMSLSGNTDRAKDLVQEAVTRAYANQDTFRSGTNLAAWLFTILRNQFRSEYRKRRREVEDTAGIHAATLIERPSQLHNIEFQEVLEVVGELSPEQHQALLLVAVGFSYEEAANRCGCAVGTVKSRVNRARTSLAAILETRAGQADHNLTRANKPRGKKPSLVLIAQPMQPASSVTVEFDWGSLLLSHTHEFPDGSVAEVFVAM